ncbi:hypothetical protein DYY66_1633 [Candidatus Nitrosotalea sp. FS]|nr:hypothetical protein [Candidatus Nitrosotalea sp. FS]
MNIIEELAGELCRIILPIEEEYSLGIQNQTLQYAHYQA